jgi:hypothetical protein
MLFICERTVSKLTPIIPAISFGAGPSPSKIATGHSLGMRPRGAMSRRPRASRCRALRSDPRGPTASALRKPAHPIPRACSSGYAGTRADRTAEYSTHQGSAVAGARRRCSMTADGCSRYFSPVATYRTDNSRTWVYTYRFSSPLKMGRDRDTIPAGSLGETATKDCRRPVATSNFTICSGMAERSGDT